MTNLDEVKIENIIKKCPDVQAELIRTGNENLSDQMKLNNKCGFLKLLAKNHWIESKQLQLPDLSNLKDFTFSAY